MTKRKGSKQQILEYFLANLGKVLESKNIQQASGGAVEWARRVRELRNENGPDQTSHHPGSTGCTGMASPEVQPIRCFQKENRAQITAPSSP